MSEVKVESATLAHSNYLWKMAGQKDLPLSEEDRQRLRDVSILLQSRPDIDMTGDFQFEVGKTYPTRGGKLVTIIGKTATREYECVQGDDMEPQLGYRYCRSTGTYDHGRATGSSGDADRNLLPVEITDPRVAGTYTDSDILAERVARIEEWLERQRNPTGEKPETLNVDWMDEMGFTPNEIRVGLIVLGHVAGKSTMELRTGSK
jgi:hypothetical protein